MKTMHLKGLGNVAIVDDEEWNTIGYFDERFLNECPPKFNPNDKDIAEYDYRLRRSKERYLLELQRRWKNV